jgi:hypothetical protein
MMEDEGTGTMEDEGTMEGDFFDLRIREEIDRKVNYAVKHAVKAALREDMVLLRKFYGNLPPESMQLLDDAKPRRVIYAVKELLETGIHRMSPAKQEETLARVTSARLERDRERERQRDGERERVPGRLRG